MTEVWSCGGGTQSAAIGALIVQGRLPRPDRAVIADTGYERSSTWEYLENVLQPAMNGIGLTIEVVRATEWAHGQEKKDLVPLYVSVGGRFRGFCSAQWKRDAIQKYLRSTGVTSARNWLGISTDELRRVRADRNGRWRVRYPLIWDVPMRRYECVDLVRSMGWPEPPRSTCWMCPNQSQTMWRDLRDNHPEDWQRAVAFEQSIHEQRQDAFLHRSRVPLPMAQIDDESGQQEMFGCDHGLCFV